MLQYVFSWICFNSSFLILLLFSRLSLEKFFIQLGGKCIVLTTLSLKWLLNISKRFRSLFKKGSFIKDFWFQFAAFLIVNFVWFSLNFVYYKTFTCIFYLLAMVWDFLTSDGIIWLDILMYFLSYYFDFKWT